MERVREAVVGRGGHAGSQVGHDLQPGRVSLDVAEADQGPQHGVVDGEGVADLVLADGVEVVGETELMVAVR